MEASVNVLVIWAMKLAVESSRERDRLQYTLDYEYRTRGFWNTILAQEAQAMESKRDLLEWALEQVRYGDETGIRNLWQRWGQHDFRSTIRLRVEGGGVDRGEEAGRPRGPGEERGVPAGQDRRDPALPERVRDRGGIRTG